MKYSSGSRAAATHYKNNASYVLLLGLLVVLLSLFASTSLHAATEDIPNLTINLVDGTKNDTPLTNTRISIREIRADGSKKWRGRIVTNEAGQASVSLAGFDAGSSYWLYARSTFNNRSKILRVEAAGTYTFRVGAPLLNITLRDAKSGSVIPNTRIAAFKIEASKKDKWLGRGTSNEQGQLSLEIPALSTSAENSAENPIVIRLRAEKIHNNLHAYSSTISEAGNVDFLVGNVQVKVISPENNQPLANKLVTIYTRPSTGKDQWYGRATTDSNGMLRLTLKDIDATSTNPPNYVLKTRRPFNNRLISSQIINHTGDYDFVVGSPLLKVTLKDASNNGASIANTEIRAFNVSTNSAGKEQRKWLGKSTTNAQGVAAFDIPALAQEGTTVRLYTKVFNNNLWAKSQLITALGSIDFNLATTLITVKDGSTADKNTFPNLQVSVHEVIASNKTKRIGRAVTDSQGILRLTLPLLETGKSYVLRTRHPNPSIRKEKTSGIINKLGNHEFIVGTELLTISLLNGITRLPVVGTRVSVYQDNGAERAKWLGKVITDSQGQGSIDVPLLSTPGHTFFLRAKNPLHAGNVKSQTFTSKTFSVNFPVGKTPVTLIDKDSGSPITNQRITAFEKLSTGRLKYRGRANTDANGTVHFDLAQLAQGKTHVFRTTNPFGQNQRFYSALVSAEAPVAFSISVDEESPLDLEAPVVTITSPEIDGNVGTEFELIGTATDDTEIDVVTVTLNNGTSSTTQTANHDTNSGIWNTAIAVAESTVDATLQVTVTATDKSGNASTVTSRYTVATDRTPPDLVVTSPADGDNVSSTGFVVRGTIADDTSILTLHAQVQDSNLGSIIDRDLNVSSNGQWTLTINNGQLSTNGSVVVRLTATDSANLQTVIVLNLNVVAVNNNAVRHVLNRITFGATPALLDEVRSSGAVNYLAAQLSPDTIDDTAFETILANLGEPFGTEELQTYQLTHMIHSRRQLREVMAWFWENHFSTNINKGNNTFSYELAEHDAFRANALGNFRTLLDISAKSPSMLIYLDGVLNVSSDANENYAREVMELHTCGVDACYTQNDVDALAEILTGWQIANDAFFFNASDHTAGSKVFQNVLIQESGVEEGDRALDMLANHAATANYICSKLIQVFVNDTPSAALNARCANTFQTAANDNDQMTQVLRVLLTSPEFNDPANFNAKVKSPVEFAVGVTRAMNAQGEFGNLSRYIRRLGIRLFQSSPPTGWSETGSAWINSAFLQERARFVNQIAVAPDSSDTRIDAVAFFRGRQLETAEDIVNYLLDLLGGDIWSDLERQTALDILNENGAFNLNATTADAQLRELIGTVLSYPEYNYQ